MIVAAAVKTSDGRVWVAARHPLVFAVIAWQVFNLRYHASHEWTSVQKASWHEYKRDWVQGFVTAGGVFLDRAQALGHVQEVGQFMTPCRAEHPNAELTSEDLW